MRTLLVISTVLAATPALAAPCSVTLARVPAEIRADIDSAIALETHCSVPIEVRIVATEDGYYLLARDLHGRVRERIVPDGHSAGVLIASWAADNLDGDDDQPPAAVAPALAPVPPIVLDPSTNAVTDRGVEPTTPHDRRTKWAGIYVLGTSLGSGIRAELDFWRTGGWTIGAAVSLEHKVELDETGPADVYNGAFGSPLELTERKAVAYAAHTTHLGDSWHVRAEAGAGVQVTEGTLEMVSAPPTELPARGMVSGNEVVVPSAEASISLGLELGWGWALAAGVLVEADLTSTNMQFGLPWNVPSTGTMSIPVDTAGVTFSILGGLRHRL